MLTADKNVSARLDIARIRDQFPALSDTDDGRARVYLDNPAGTQVPRIVAERMSDCLLHRNANIGGYFRTSELAAEVVDNARSAVADFLNAPSTDEITFGQNMTNLTLHLSRSIGRHFKAGDEIIVTKMDHDANIEPWALLARDHNLTVRKLPFDKESYEFDLSELDRLLTDRTRLVCVGGASNLTGTLNDITTICSKAREVGAWTYIDAVQSAPHVATDVQSIGCDFFVCSPYKFFGPHQGVLWGRRELLETLVPYKVRPAPDELPWRFEPGTPSIEGLAGTAAAIDYFAWVGETMGVVDAAGAKSLRARQVSAAFESMFEYEKALAIELISGLKALPGITVHGITAQDAMDRRVPTVSFTHASQHPDVIAKALADRGIFVWSGHNYAVEIVTVLDLLQSGGVVRAGPVHYNTAAEIDVFLNALEDELG
ncbi:MAG: cysteine desulfurase-like protein [Gammaproteobacteria bacterium]|nr:cysteine desulfurase-like protein [Gammaproteobacteria bacterium]